MKRSIDRLLKFARRFVAASVRRARVDVQGARYPRQPWVEGFAWEGTIDGVECDPPWVEIFLPRRLTERAYPRKLTYRVRAGEIKYRCWHEEVLTTIAHELRHIQQYTIPRRARVKHPEVDAELFAKFVLEQYRLKKRCKHEQA